MTWMIKDDIYHKDEFGKDEIMERRPLRLLRKILKRKIKEVHNTLNLIVLPILLHYV